LKAAPYLKLLAIMSCHLLASCCPAAAAVVLLTPLIFIVTLPLWLIVRLR
jgi:hypothetical protein